MAKYKRNGPLVLSQLHENASGQVIAKVPMTIQAPVRFPEIGLGQIGVDTFEYGLIAIVLDDGPVKSYAVLNVNALLELNPYKMSIITVNDIDYHQLFFDTGDVVFKTLDLVQKDSIIFNVFDEMIFKGKVPWYVEYEDLGKLFDTSLKHTGSNFLQNPEVMEFIASMITRNKADRMKYVREGAEDIKAFALENIDYVPLKSVFYSVKSTVNKLTGSYFNDGVTGSLVMPTEKVDKIEKVLRS